MRLKMIVIAVRRLVREILKFAVFLDLDKFRHLSKLIHRKLRNHRPQPTGQRASPGIIRQLALFVTVRIDPQPVKLGPDRACEILGIFADSKTSYVRPT